MDACRADSPLTPEQSAVVEQPADALVLVTAGAGAGKTYTLVRRLDHLLEDAGLSAGEILVLSFSRAAVRELRERILLQGGEDARQVRVTTFDSWALDVLTRIDPTTDWRSTSFDERIEQAADAIAAGRADVLFEKELGHVVVDEVQDLTGGRSILVENLLERFDCGFTVVGDAAQAIYAFSVSDPNDLALEPGRFFRSLQTLFDEDLVHLTLSGNFRARTQDARTALRFESRVRDSGDLDARGAENLHAELREELLATSDFGDLHEPYFQELLSDPDRSTALLCRTNGQALLIAEQLYTLGIDHQLRRGARDRSAPAWLEALLREVDGPSLSRRAWDDLHHAGHVLPTASDGDRLWRLLRGSFGDPTGRTVALDRLRDALAGDRLPDELTAQPEHHLVVSTFHRAKGLEFDRVLVVDPGPLDASRFDSPTLASEEIRTLYVATTRPREELYRHPSPDVRHVRRCPATGRWGRYGWKKWERKGIEMKSGDVHVTHPAGTAGFSGDVKDLQRLLRERLTAGTPVTLERIDATPHTGDENDPGAMSPCYLIRAGDRPIGLVSDSFRKDLYRYQRQGPKHHPSAWPGRITGVHIESVETVIGSAAAGIAAGLGEHGVWLAPRLGGLSRFHYDHTIGMSSEGNHD
ncbi:ATP-dependent helicase [Streptomyces mirabilis]|uniref:ATP-dependent helicase n=1 Tax=Streptomyces mirabilis TaxID=68239 RepID=UPI0022517842|nr:ATP-dependent helicase [Streptomyces mirabilis]MCX4429590.1 ATP-dependent helicase [Streptomyces mirabilis]